MIYLLPPSRMPVILRLITRLVVSPGAFVTIVLKRAARLCSFKTALVSVVLKRVILTMIGLCRGAIVGQISARLRQQSCPILRLDADGKSTEQERGDDCSHGFFSFLTLSSQRVDLSRRFFYAIA